MARLPSRSLLHGASGTIGKQIVLKRYGITTVVSKYPDMSRVKPSPLQVQRRALFREAVCFARLINRHPDLRKAYEETSGESVFHKAKQEYLNRLQG